MAEFDEIREELGRARTERDLAEDNLARARERLKRLTRDESELNRIANAEDEEHQAQLRRLQEDLQQAEAELRTRLVTQTRVKTFEADLFNRFATLTDPREAIARLTDDIPILLMPVRLETRFKTFTEGEATSNQLWVRIYPDDCWIDSFDPALTETEVKDAKTYWIGIWKAGRIEDQERAAWRTLAGSHGSGRAAWIISQFKPVTETPPIKPRAQDVILTIATETPLAAGEEPDVVAFWREVWLADGDAAKVAAAQAALETAVGQSRAAEIVANYQPVNFADPLASGVTKDQVNVSVAIVVFAPIETRENAWSRAPKMNILPDRFVFIGFEGTNPTVVEVGRAVPTPLIAGPDPSAPQDQQLRHDAAGNLVVPEELKWMTDFDRAVEVGMGFRLNLTPTQATNGFDRVLVVGLRLSADQQRAKAELETLFRNHSFSQSGLAVVPQGTPTNNTDAVKSGFDRFDDPDESFNDHKLPLFTSNSNWLNKKDGQWIAEYLGLDPKLFENVHLAGASDQLTERAMNIALWPATFGYWMESMMAPVFTRNGIEQTRDFFNRYVIGSGAIPAIRIGSQPYGILPATTISRMQWINQRQIGVAGFLDNDSTLLYLRRLYPILLAINTDWTAMLDDVSFVGQPGDPHAILLDILGLHSGSVEWSQRYAESLETVFNRLNLLGLGGLIQTLVISGQWTAAQELIQRLGSPPEVKPLILNKIFFGNHYTLSGGVVDDKPLSEKLGIRPYTDTEQNYIQWLIDAAQTSFDLLYKQDGFKDDQLPPALLFLLLRHALQLGYHDVSIRAAENAGVLTAELAAKARTDDPFLHIRENVALSESRYRSLYSVEPAITGSPTQTVHQFITTGLTSLTSAFYLREMLAALEQLKIQPTARLERAFADHVDCCSYRLDSWLLGIVNFQLTLMRNIGEGQDSPPRQGIYLGGYAWLENLRPDNKILTPVTLRDPDLITDFGGAPPLLSDSTNEGFIHAPSLNHAVAAAVLRNGFISNASPENRQTMAVNLTSERVRIALALLEGIRGGQGLADLLGYQFERGLHDRHNLAEVDQVIFKLRRVFPLRADHLNSTRPPEGVSIESIEARNVIDGLALVDQIKSGNKAYPFGKTGLPTDLTQQQLDAINAEADRLLESHDAVADLSLSEGVYQAVLGNYDRVASTYDAYARAQFPPEPDIIRTPLNGVGLTHRVGLHLEAGVDPGDSPILNLPMTPRAQAEPALNKWLASILPPLDQVAAVVSFKRASSGLSERREVNLFELDLQPADLVAIIQEGNEQAMAELDDRIVRRVVENFGPRPDVPIAISYLEGSQVSVFQLLPLVRNLRRLTTRSRPLQATDLKLSNEATTSDDSQPFVDIQRLRLVHIAMQTLRGDLATFQTDLEGPLSDLENRKDEILADADQYVERLVDLLARSATFVVAHAGWGFAYAFRRDVFSAILKQSQELVTRWNDKLIKFEALLVEEDALPDDSVVERLLLLRRAEETISTLVTEPLPEPDDFRDDLINIKRPALVQKRDDFAAVQNTTRTEVTRLLEDVKDLMPITDFDFTEFSFAAHEDALVLFTQDAVALAKVIIAELDQRISAGEELFDQHDTAADAATKVRLLENASKILLGPDFRMFPEFSLGTRQGNELENSFAASRSGELFQHLTNPPDPNILAEDFPVDTWLYGVARVREKMHAWEQTLMFTGGLGQLEPQLEAIQLPFIPGDRWLGLEFPSQQKLDQDRLLYTVHLATPFNKLARQCGMLLDEWNETIPAAELDTGIAFHHDRPNSEAPQTMLLVTPSVFRGAWQWQDLIDALNETFDFAKRRAIEPRRIDRTAYAPFLPASIMASQFAQLTIAADLALNNTVTRVLE
jgi:hypothetical protein